MLDILPVIFVLTARQCFCQPELNKSQYKPHLFTEEIYATRQQLILLQNMTEKLVTDAYIKMRHAETIQGYYANSMNYELGILAATLMDSYRHMIKTYKYYSNHKNFKNEDYTIAEIMNGYSNLQGDYNQMVADTKLFHKVLETHKQAEKDDIEEARNVSKKTGMSIHSILTLKKNGMNLSEIMNSRRSMPPNLPDLGKNQLGGKGDAPRSTRRQFLLEEPMSRIHIWAPKKNYSNNQEEEYKKKMRYTKWAEKWNGFDGEKEGVHIPDTVARLGLTNDSNFLLKDLKGAL